MSARHTQGKVSAIYPCLYAAEGRRIFELENGTTNELQRLAACWNSCIGVPTEVLESALVSEALWQDLTAQRNRLIAERDQLLDVLQHIRRCIPLGGFAQIHDGSATLADMDAAIAACQPQPTIQHLPADDTEGGAA
jgi:hypothetical protein